MARRSLSITAVCRVARNGSRATRVTKWAMAAEVRRPRPSLACSLGVHAIHHMDSETTIAVLDRLLRK